MGQNMLQSRLTLLFYGGLDEYGKEVFSRKNFNNIDMTASDEQLKNTAEALASLQQHVLEGITRSNIYDVHNL